VESLVSPLDMRRFIDQFESPWVRAHFDVGNVTQFGYPQDWIRTLGPRIARVHLKDYKLAAGGVQGKFVPLLEGDVQWKEVMANLVKAGYRGCCSVELGPDPKDPDLLMKTSRAVDRILALA
jgi:hexulose-6-phosphate isomerase